MRWINFARQDLPSFMRHDEAQRFGQCRGAEFSGRSPVVTQAICRNRLGGLTDVHVAWRTHNLTPGYSMCGWDGAGRSGPKNWRPMRVAIFENDCFVNPKRFSSLSTNYMYMLVDLASKLQQKWSPIFHSGFTHRLTPRLKARDISIDSRPIYLAARPIYLAGRPSTVTT